VFLNGAQFQDHEFNFGLRAAPGPVATIVDDEIGNRLVSAVKVGSGRVEFTATGSYMHTPFPAGTQPSSFSSWGPSPYLELKPELAAPGAETTASNFLGRVAPCIARRGPPARGRS
jgi:hypothetical protein